jgi:hypothetical protein
MLFYGAGATVCVTLGQMTPHEELESAGGEREREAQGDIRLEGLGETGNNLRIICFRF